MVEHKLAVETPQSVRDVYVCVCVCVCVCRTMLDQGFPQTTK